MFYRYHFSRTRVRYKHNKHQLRPAFGEIIWYTMLYSKVHLNAYAGR